MALEGKTDDVLEPFHQGSVADTPLVLAVVRINVGNQKGNATVSLDCFKLIRQPGKLVSRIASLTEEPPVQAVTNLRVVSNQSGTTWHLLAVT